MKKRGFIRAWMEEAKRNDELDKAILEMIDDSLEDSLDEDGLLDTLLGLTKAKGDQDEAN
jgi:hypothetical protein